MKAVAASAAQSALGVVDVTNLRKPLCAAAVPVREPRRRERGSSRTANLNPLIFEECIEDARSRKRAATSVLAAARSADAACSTTRSTSSSPSSEPEASSTTPAGAVRARHRAPCAPARTTCAWVDHQGARPPWLGRLRALARGGRETSRMRDTEQDRAVDSSVNGDLGPGRGRSTIQRGKTAAAATAALRRRLLTPMPR
jgi:hypothetical protein